MTSSFHSHLHTIHTVQVREITGFFEHPAWVKEWLCWSNVKVICGAHLLKNILYLDFPVI